MPAGTGFGYGYSTLQVAWYAVPQALGSLACLVVIRRLVPRGHRAATLALGAGSIVLAFVVFGLLIRSPGATMTGLLLDSTGLGVTLAVSQIIIVRALTPAESGIALGLSIVLYAVGNTAGSAVVGVLFKSLTIGHTPLPSLAAFRWGFAISGAAAVLALGCSAALARRHEDVRAAGPIVA
jgi:predicted MFS family arabinose efflux permease